MTTLNLEGFWKYPGADSPCTGPLIGRYRLRPPGRLRALDLRVSEVSLCIYGRAAREWLVGMPQVAPAVLAVLAVRVSWASKVWPDTLFMRAYEYGKLGKWAAVLYPADAAQNYSCGAGSKS